MSDEKIATLGERLDDLNKQIAAVQKQLDEARGTACEVYSRISGYYRAVQRWNVGKAQEFKDRKCFDLPNEEQNKALEQRKKPTCRVGNARVCEYYSRGEQSVCANIPCAKEVLGKKGTMAKEKQRYTPDEIDVLLQELNEKERSKEASEASGEKKKEGNMQVLSDKELDNILNGTDNNDDLLAEAIGRAADEIRGKKILSDEQVSELLNASNDTCESCKIDNSKIENTPVYHGEQVPKATTIDDWGVLNVQEPTKWTKYKDIAKDFYAELYTKETCPNCPAVIKWLEGAPFPIHNIDVGNDAGIKIAGENGVFSSPTVIFKKGDKELGRAHSVNDLRGIFKGVAE